MKKLLIILFVSVVEFTTVAHGCDKLTNPNCTEDSVTKQYIIHEEANSRSSLAWLVTPALFSLGVFYLIYKCCRDGLCNCRKLRERAALEHREEQGYVPLSEVALFSTSQVPCAHPGVVGPHGRQLVLVHNQTFCVALDPHLAETGCTISGPPTYQEAVFYGGARGSSVARPEVQVANPPSYISSKPPRYSVAVGEDSPHPSVSEEDPDIILVSEVPRQLRFVSNRRRHRSAQDSRVKHDRRRHFSAQDRRGSIKDEDNDPIRQRCFSFNAIKDAFKRSHQNMPECESLLSQDENNSVFSSREAISSPGPTIQPMTFVTTSVFAATPRIPRRQPQQVSFEERILEDSESNETLEQDQTAHSHIIPAHLRQRHFSAPDSSRSKNTRTRNASGST